MVLIRLISWYSQLKLLLGGSSVMESDSSNLVRFDPTLVIVGNQMDPGDENVPARRQRQDTELMPQNALFRSKRLDVTRFIERHEIPVIGPEVRAA